MTHIESECSEATQVESKPAFYSVAIYLVDRAFGEPEEGGWWYNYGVLVQEIPEGINPHDLISIFTDEEEADGWAAALQQQLDTYPNKQRRSDISSVLSEGCYVAEVYEGWPPTHWPEQTPHYE